MDGYDSQYMDSPMSTGTSHGKCPSHSESFSFVITTTDIVGLTLENVDNSMDARNQWILRLSYMDGLENVHGKSS